MFTPSYLGIPHKLILVFWLVFLYFVLRKITPMFDACASLSSFRFLTRSKICAKFFSQHCITLITDHSGVLPSPQFPNPSSLRLVEHQNPVPLSLEVITQPLTSSRVGGFFFVSTFLFHMQLIVS